MPLAMHAATNRFGSGEGDRASTNRFSVTVNFDHYVRMSLTDMIFCGVFERYPRLQMGAVEHEVSWAAHFLDRMDYNYTQRARGVSGYRFKNDMLPSDFSAATSFSDSRRTGWASSSVTSLGRHPAMGLGLPTPGVHLPQEQGNPGRNPRRMHP